MENLRPLHHIAPVKGWINDPNGVIKYKDKYHVFYQYHPYSLVWGPMHWGHVVSDDLLHWEHLPIALTPGDEFDLDGCFSGSAIVYNDRLYLIYTGFIDGKGVAPVIQRQCLAYSDDGINFTKVGLIIKEDDLPEDYSISDFRDPMVYQDNDEFILLVAAKRKSTSKGNILKYKSKDLLHWEFVSDILENDSTGLMIECVDYVKDLNLLINSEQLLPLEGYKYHNSHSCLYRLGEFNKNNKFIYHHEDMLDYGFDYYAPQVILDGNYLIAWMNMWDRTNPSEKYNFAGSMTIPRHLEIRNNDLYQTPVLPKGRVEKYELKDKYSDHLRVGFYKIEIDDLKSFSLLARKGKEHFTSFNLENKEWVFNRFNSGEKIRGCELDNDSLNGVRRMPYIKNKHHDVYIVLDEFSIEIFVDGRSMTSLIYPDLEDDLFELEVHASNVVLYKYLDD